VVEKVEDKGNMFLHSGWRAREIERERERESKNLEHNCVITNMANNKKLQEKSASYATDSSKIWQTR